MEAIRARLDVRSLIRADPTPIGLPSRQGTAETATRESELRARLAQSEAARVAAVQDHEATMAALRIEYGTTKRRRISCSSLTVHLERRTAQARAQALVSAAVGRPSSGVLAVCHGPPCCL
jgi:hypothetical protein